MADNDSSAGATPAAGGATPPQTPPAPPAPASPPAAPAPPATGDDALGEGGKKALAAERTARQEAEDRAKKLEKELADLKAANLSESEQALLKARTDGEATATERLAARLRESAVREALIAAGAQPSLVPLAAGARDFSGLPVTETGDITGVTAAIETFKAANPDIFTKPAAPGTADGGSRGGGGSITKEQAKAWAKDPILYEQHRDEILAAMARP